MGPVISNCCMTEKSHLISRSEVHFKQALRDFPLDIPGGLQTDREIGQSVLQKSHAGCTTNSQDDRHANAWGVDMQPGHSGKKTETGDSQPSGDISGLDKHERI